MKIRILLICFMISLSALWPSESHAWLLYHKPAFKGKVIDAETKAPIEGAVVVVVYEKINAGLGPGWSASPFDAREALTDREGMFNVPSYTTLISPFSFNSNVNFIIFKPGYGSYPCCQKVPNGITRTGEEEFFSEDFGKERKIELWVGEGRGSKLRFVNATYGVVELPELKTVKEKREAELSERSLGPYVPTNKIPNFMRLKNEGETMDRKKTRTPKSSVSPEDATPIVFPGWQHKEN